MWLDLCLTARTTCSRRIAIRLFRCSSCRWLCYDHRLGYTNKRRCIRPREYSRATFLEREWADRRPIARSVVIGEGIFHAGKVVCYGKNLAHIGYGRPGCPVGSPIGITDKGLVQPAISFSDRAHLIIQIGVGSRELVASVGLGSAWLRLVLHRVIKDRRDYQLFFSAACPR